MEERTATVGDATMTSDYTHSTTGTGGTRPAAPDLTERVERLEHFKTRIELLVGLLTGAVTLFGTFGIAGIVWLIVSITELKTEIGEVNRRLASIEAKVEKQADGVDMQAEMRRLRSQLRQMGDRLEKMEGEPGLMKKGEEEEPFSPPDTNVSPKGTPP